MQNTSAMLAQLLIEPVVCVLCLLGRFCYVVGLLVATPLDVDGTVVVLIVPFWLKLGCIPVGRSFQGSACSCTGL
jgi:hypothetical protein